MNQKKIAAKASFDALIHEPNRLQICAFLDPLAEAEFKALREDLGISESALSKHIKALEEAEYLKLEKRGKGHKRTWIGLTSTGRQAFKNHIQALQDLIGLSSV